MKNTIILTGMSGVGKSHHSRILHQDHGYELFSIDDMIAQALGEGNVHDVAKFLGAPYEAKYKDSSTTYLALEEKFTNDVLDYAETHPEIPIVIDTTGSLVHLSDDTLERIMKSKHTIFLDTKEGLVDQMISNYLNDPKPVIWGDHASLFTEQEYQEQLQQLYPKLLRERRDKYLSVSTTTIPFDEHKSDGFSVFDRFSEKD